MDPQLLSSILSLSEILVGFALLFVISLALIAFTVWTINTIKEPDYAKQARESDEEVNGQFQD